MFLTSVISLCIKLAPVVCGFHLRNFDKNDVTEGTRSSTGAADVSCKQSKEGSSTNH